MKLKKIEKCISWIDFICLKNFGPIPIELSTARKRFDKAHSNRATDWRRTGMQECPSMPVWPDYVITRELTLDHTTPRYFLEVRTLPNISKNFALGVTKQIAELVTSDDILRIEIVQENVANLWLGPMEVTDPALCTQQRYGALRSLRVTKSHAWVPEPWYLATGRDPGPAPRHCRPGRPSGGIWSWNPGWDFSSRCEVGDDGPPFGRPSRQRLTTQAGLSTDIHGECPQGVGQPVLGPAWRTRCTPAAETPRGDCPGRELVHSAPVGYSSQLLWLSSRVYRRRRLPRRLASAEVVARLFVPAVDRRRPRCTLLQKRPRCCSWVT